MKTQIFEGSYFTVIVAAILLVSSVAAFAATNLVVGRYRFSVITGWQKKVIERQAKHYHFIKYGKTYDFTRGYYKSVEFSKTMSGTSVSLELSMNSYSKPFTERDLAAIFKESQKVISLLVPATGLKDTVLQSAPTRFQGYKAYVSHTRDPDYKKAGLVDLETIAFIDGKNLYTLSKTMTGSPSPQVKVRAEQEWQSFKRGLRPIGNSHALAR